MYIYSKMYKVYLIWEWDGYAFNANSPDKDCAYE